MMGEVLPKHIAAIEEGQLHRGWLVNAYAQIEFLLGDLIYRCREIEEYKEISGRLPHGAPKRIEKVRKLLQRDGPLQEFQTDIEGLIADFEKAHENRNLLAHGFCEFHYTKDDDCAMVFKKWHRDEELGDVQIIRSFRMVDMQYEKEQLIHLSQTALELFQRIHRKFGWGD